MDISAAKRLPSDGSWQPEKPEQPEAAGPLEPLKLVLPWRLGDIRDDDAAPADSHGGPDASPCCGWRMNADLAL